MPDRPAIPLIDALSGWPMPEQQESWLGEASVEAQLREAYVGGRMHHAWLIGGPKGVGKATLAFRAARYILANPDPALATPGSSLAVAPDDRVFRKIAAGAHPNLLVLRRPWDEQAKRYRSELTVGEVRRIQSFFGSTAGEKGARICIVDTADELNASAANALLKVLEEPPAQGLFFIVSSRPGRLLPTIRSRCRRLDLRPIQRDAVRAALAEGEPESLTAEIDLAASLSSGSLRRAIEFVREEGGG
ncbi:MAG: DNA polymerase III subunit delta', partial [Alphaproteobacteria bacterium]